MNTEMNTEVKRGRPRKDKPEKEKVRIYRYETEEERKESQKRAKDKYNEKKLYSNKIICECGCEITIGNKSRHMKSKTHNLLLQLNASQLKNSI
jgi:hypothetical protein